MKELVLSLSGRVGCGRESGERVKGTTDDIGHKWRDATRKDGGEDGREDENEEIATGEEGEEEWDGSLRGRAYRSGRRRLNRVKSACRLGEVGRRCGRGGRASRGSHVGVDDEGRRTTHLGCRKNEGKEGLRRGSDQ